jgi:hypothetical protein
MSTSHPVAFSLWQQPAPLPGPSVGKWTARRGPRTASRSARGHATAAACTQPCSTRDGAATSAHSRGSSAACKRGGTTAPEEPPTSPSSSCTAASGHAPTANPSGPKARSSRHGRRRVRTGMASAVGVSPVSAAPRYAARTAASATRSLSTSVSGTDTAAEAPAEGAVGTVDVVAGRERRTRRCLPQ